MTRFLDPGYRFSVEERKGQFEIKDLIGFGASCAVYSADFVDEHKNRTEHLLKEYNPKQINLFRDEDGVLHTVNKDDEAVFRGGMHRFMTGYEKQSSIRRLNELKNVTSNIQGIYHVNGTQYIDMTCFSGQTYDKVQEKSVYDLLRRMRAVTQVIGCYHSAGFLHLDIKPENIYTIPETCEMVMLFDFDSVIELGCVYGSTILSYTKSWAAPEQIVPGHRKKICRATDLFAVGEMIFYQLIGRHSTVEERRSFAKYEFDVSTSIFENLNPKVIPMLEDLLHRTICNSPKNRFQTAEDLINKLDAIISLANPEKPFLKSSPFTIQQFFIGRNEEINEIHQKLSENRILFLSGIGGIGKSELAKQYAEQHRNEYDVVIFAPYVSSISMLLQDDISIPLHNFARYPEEKPAEYCARKLQKLQELCNNQTLFIVDNLDCDDDPDFKKLLELGCKLLITTRLDFSEYHMGNQLNLNALRNRENIRKIFDKHYTKPLVETENTYIEGIIDFVAGHTMTVELLAKQMMAGRIRPDNMLAKLQECGISESGKEKIRSGKHIGKPAQSTYDHIQVLFDLSILDNSKQSILKKLSLIPHTGIPAELFYNWCSLDTYDQINSLAFEGWIQKDQMRDYISLHPLIAQLAFEKLKTSPIPLNLNLFPIQKEMKLHEQAELTTYMATKILKLDYNTIDAAVFLRNTVSNYQWYYFSQPSLAIACLDKSLDIFRMVFNNAVHTEIAECYYSLGNYYAMHDNYCALDYYDQYLLCIQKIKQRSSKPAYTKTNEVAKILRIGLLFEQMGNPQKAIKYYRYAHNYSSDFLRLINNSLVFRAEIKQTLLLTFNNYLTIALIKLNKYSAAISPLEQMQQSYRHTQYDISEMRVIDYILCGILEQNSSRHNDALEHFEKALKIQISEYGYTRDVALISQNLGMLYMHIKNWERSETHLKTALKICNDLTGVDMSSIVSRIYEALGVLSYHKKCQQQATEYLEKARHMQFKATSEYTHPEVLHMLQLNEAIYLINKGSNDNLVKKRIPQHKHFKNWISTAEKDIYEYIHNKLLYICLIELETNE